VIEDVSAPSGAEVCECQEIENDGILDLLLKFDIGDVVETLELNGLEAGASVQLSVTGKLLDGTPLTATDCVRLVPPGDYDLDNDVDLADFSALQVCFNGPNRAHNGPVVCAEADADQDGDVDMADFGQFQQCFNGPNRPAACP
jgi:hypothetical protein